MGLQVDCTCGQRLAVGDDQVGRSVRCPNCGATVVVPVPVWAPVEIEKLPTLRAEPVFSSYTLPPPPAPSLWSQYKLWVLGAAGVVVLVAGVVGAIIGFIWISKFIDPANISRPAAGSNSGAAPETVNDAGQPSSPASSRPGATPQKTDDSAGQEKSAFPGMKSGDDEDFE